MPEIFQFNERPDSRAWTTDPPGVTYRYKASGEHDDGIDARRDRGNEPPPRETDSL